MVNSLDFATWFKPIVDATGLKKKEIAKRADIDPVSFSRILSGAHGVSRTTGLNLVKAINEMVGREVADENTAVRILAGLPADDGIDEGLYRGLDQLSPERQELARRQIRAIIDSLAEQDHDTDYIDDEETQKQ